MIIAEEFDLSVHGFASRANSGKSDPFRPGSGRGGPGSVSDAESSTKGGIRSEDEEDDIEDEDESDNNRALPPHAPMAVGGRRPPPQSNNGGSSAGGRMIVSAGGTMKQVSAGTSYFPPFYL